MIFSKISWLTFAVLCPISICMSTTVSQRVLNWQNAEISVADLLCNITIPQEFWFPIFAVFGIAACNSIQIWLSPMCVVCFKKRNKVARVQMLRSILYSFLGMIWIIFNVIVFAFVNCDSMINWLDYDSAFFLEMNVLSDREFFVIFEAATISVFFELLNTIWFLTLLMLVFHKYYIGLFAFALIYLYDASSLRMQGVYYLRYSLIYENCVRENLIEYLLVPNIIISLVMITALKTALDRKDFF